MILRIARAHQAQLLTTYALTAAANLAGQLYPLATAVAISGVLEGDYRQIGWLLACHVATMSLDVSARLYDTRVFVRVYTRLACEVVQHARAQGIDSSVIAGRAALSREFIDFLEQDLPGIASAVIGLLVAVAVLIGMDPVIGFACLLLFAPLAAISRRLSMRSLAMTRRLNDRMEREIAVLREARLEVVRRHFDVLGKWRVRLSDAEARAFGLMEVCVIVPVAAALMRLSQSEAVQAGDVYAVFSYIWYIWRFVVGLDQVPPTVQRIAKLRDLTRRISLQDTEPMPDLS